MAKKPSPSTTSPAHPPVTSRRQVQQLMEKASAALAHSKYFKAEQLANSALHGAWSIEDYDSIARIAMPLQEARRQRRIAAAEAGAVHVVDKKLPRIGKSLKPGCYVVGPPHVGADARRILEGALEHEIPVIAFAREPMTRLKQLPIVVVAAATIRRRINPPKEMTVDWCLDVVDLLTEEALAFLDTTRTPARQVDDLIDMLDTLPESELLHQRLADTARVAARESGSKDEPVESLEHPNADLDALGSASAGGAPPASKVRRKKTTRRLSTSAKKRPATTAKKTKKKKKKTTTTKKKPKSKG